MFKTSSSQILLFYLILSVVLSTPLMIEEKDEFLQKIKAKNIAVIFYGNADTPQYHNFEQLIPAYNQLFEGLEFLYVPASKFKLNRNNPSLMVYRNIGGGDWQQYQGSFDKADMDKWIQHHTTDPIKQLTIDQLEQTFRNGLKSFILLSYGQFELLRTKIYINDFCVFKKIKCWKIQPNSAIYSTVTQLLGMNKQDHGISKLAFYNPSTERMQLYTKDVWMLRRQQLLELFEGRKGIIHTVDTQLQADVQIQLHYQAQVEEEN